MTIQRSDPDRLYRLLPSIDRVNDATYREPLRALLRIIASQADLLRIDVQELWNNFFIETCDRWVVPYIGDLVGNRTLTDVDYAAAERTALSLFGDLARPDLRPISKIRTRTDVAKTIYYRRRKGTVAMLAELAHDVTGWAAHVVEFFTQLTWNQNVNHLRPSDVGCVDVRSVDGCGRVDGPFDPASHTVDVRPFEGAEGWYGTLNVGFFLWRLTRYAIGNPQLPAHNNVQPHKFAQPYRMTFSVLGNDAPLFTNWRDEPGVPTGPDNVPGPIPVPLFHDEPQRYYPTSLSIASNLVTIGSSLIACRNLKHWQAMPQPTGQQVLVDVDRGRLMVGDAYDPTKITVSYCYGFSADMGGGPYDRHKWLAPIASRRVIAVPADQPDLDQALTQWAANRGVDTIIRIASNEDQAITQQLDLDPLASLTIEADNFYRPHVTPKNSLIVVQGAASARMLTLSGLLIEGGISIEQDLETLRLVHTTLVPAGSIAFDGGEAPPPSPQPPIAPAIQISTGTAGAPINAGLHVDIAYSIVGPIRAAGDLEGLWLLDSIVDGVSDVAVSDDAHTGGPPAWIERSTLIGKTFFKRLYASESIFSDLVTVEQHVGGCVRFSYVPSGSSTPRQYRCQPAREIALEQDAAKAAALAHGTTLVPGWDLKIASAVAAWLVPSFGSTRYGDPTYVQLRLAAPVQIAQGAEDGAEIGAFNHLKQPQRESNLRLRLQEYLPFGLVAGFIYVN